MLVVKDMFALFLRISAVFVYCVYIYVYIYDRGISEAEGGGGSEGACWSGDMKEVRQIWRVKVVDSFKSVHKDFELNSLCDWEPVKLP